MRKFVRRQSLMQHTHLELLKTRVQVQLHGLGVAQIGAVTLVAVPAQPRELAGTSQQQQATSLMRETLSHVAQEHDSGGTANIRTNMHVRSLLPTSDCAEQPVCFQQSTSTCLASQALQVC